MAGCSWRARPTRSRTIRVCAPSTSGRAAMTELLVLDNLSAGYGEATVLGGVSFSIGDGRSLALLGRNGTGKTTLINSIVGLTTYKSGSIRLNGRDITPERPERRVAAGGGWSPQERNIFR